MRRKYNTFDKKTAQRYDRWYETPFGAYSHSLEKDLVFKLLGDVEKNLVLDSGCGTGNYSLELRRKGALVVGLDSSFEMIKIARNKASLEGLEINWVLASNGNLPFKDKCFDKMISVTSLEFCKGHVKEIAGEMVRTTKNRMIIGFLNKWSLFFIQKRIEGVFKDSIYNTAHFYNILEMKKLFGEIRWKSTLFALPWLPESILRRFIFLEKVLSIILKPFGGFIGVIKNQ